MKIHVERNLSPEQLNTLGIETWPTWSSEVFIFPWTYESTEACYFLEGEVVVTPEGGEPVKIGKGDFATFPKGMACTWDVRQPLKKHYRFE